MCSAELCCRGVREWCVCVLSCVAEVYEDGVCVLLRCVARVLEDGVCVVLSCVTRVWEDGVCVVLSGVEEDGVIASL